MTTITTTTDPTQHTEPSTGRRVAKAVAGVAVGVAIGWFAASAAESPSASLDRVAEVPPPAVAEVRPSTGAEVTTLPDFYQTSPDAYERWAQGELLRRSEGCTSAFVSADALERCMSTPR